MPLHSGVGGVRGVLDNRALLATGSGRLPRELEAEIRLLEPDAEVAALYHFVPPLNDEGILHRLLEDERPHRFVDLIMAALRSNSDGDAIILPRNRTLRDRLKDRPWLPGSNGGAGVAPELLIDLPGELPNLVATLTGALGKFRLPKQVAADRWDAAKEAVHEILGRPSPAEQVERLAGGLDTEAVANHRRGLFSHPA